MLKEGIIYAGNEYLLDKKIATEKCTYYAYKNEELRKIYEKNDISVNISIDVNPNNMI